MIIIVNNCSECPYARTVWKRSEGNSMLSRSIEKCHMMEPISGKPDSGKYSVCEFIKSKTFPAWCPLEKEKKDDTLKNAEGQGCRASRHTLDPLVGHSESGVE